MKLLLRRARIEIQRQAGQSVDWLKAAEPFQLHADVRIDVASVRDPGQRFRLDRRIASGLGATQRLNSFVRNLNRDTKQVGALKNVLFGRSSSRVRLRCCQQYAAEEAGSDRSQQLPEPSSGPAERMAPSTHTRTPVTRFATWPRANGWSKPIE